VNVFKPSATLAPERTPYRTPSRTQYRLLEPSDAQAYKALRDASLKAAPEAFTSDFESQMSKSADSYLGRLMPLSHLRPGMAVTLGAFDASGALLGALTCERDARTKKSHCADIIAMMVAPAAQKQGIALNLIANLVELVCRNTDLQLLTLSVTASNAHTVRLYERAGFTTYGRLDRAIRVEGRYFDKLLMQRWIAKSP
jgi:RimJ/RimL family protein N-acetyltransferase